MRLIDADALIKEINISKLCGDCAFNDSPFCDLRGGSVCRAIRNAPTIEAKSIRHGKWIDVNGDGSLYKCSVCGETQCCNSNYCGECGARMEIEEWSEPILYLFPI